MCNVAEAKPVTLFIPKNLTTSALGSVVCETVPMLDRILSAKLIRPRRHLAAGTWPSVSLLSQRCISHGKSSYPSHWRSSLSFALEPLVALLRRWHFGGVPSVIAAVLLAFLVIFGVVALIGGQLTHLAERLPQ